MRNWNGTNKAEKGETHISTVLFIRNGKSVGRTGPLFNGLINQKSMSKAGGSAFVNTCIGYHFDWYGMRNFPKKYEKHIRFLWWSWKIMG